MEALGILGVLFAIAMFVAGLALYFLPWVIASRREHPAVTPIALLNIFTGWTFIGWIGALVWAVSEKT